MCVLLRELGDAEQVLKVAALGQRPTLESADGKTAVLSGSDESRAAKEGEGWGGEHSRGCLLFEGRRLECHLSKAAQNLEVPRK